MIDLTLTSEFAKVDIGMLIPLIGIRSFPKEVVGSARVPSPVFEVSWSFKEGDSLVSAIKHYQTQRRAGARYPLQQETRAVLHQYISSGIPFFVATYDAFYHTYYDTRDRLFCEYQYPNFDGHSLLEGLLNAIEHGSQFGKNGAVEVKMYGGENGALFVIENQRTSFELKPPTLQEIITRYRHAGYEFRDVPTTYADIFRTLCAKDVAGIPPGSTGLCTYTLSPKAIIGAEQDNLKFRLLILYPTPRLLQEPVYRALVQKLNAPEEMLVSIEISSDGHPQAGAKPRLTLL